MSKKNLTIRDIRDSDIRNIYEKLILNQSLNDKEKIALLKLAIIFINENDIYVKNFGYRILLIYSNIYKEYKILYDIAINQGFIPISKFIDNYIYNNVSNDSFFNNFTSSFMENFKQGDMYLTYEQKKLNLFLDEYEDSTLSIIAPTSYGKSNIIIETIKENQTKKICVIVPSKALLEQTKRRIFDAKVLSKELKIITHPEMYNKNLANNIIAVLTQERLLRLLKENESLYFDTLFVDEAHNILNNDDRNMLLASTIIILNKRNPSIKLKFLTPFLMDSKNLKLVYTNYQIKEFKINEYIKSERLYVIDFRPNKEKKLQLYDQFLNHFFDLEHESDTTINFIQDYSLSKNIIYFNRPILIEEFTRDFIKQLDEVSSEKIEQICQELKKHLHKDYYLIDAIKHGVIYHHGSVPSYIRLYIEHLFKNEDLIRYIVTSSTLMEGVNIPAETLFLLQVKKGRSNLTPSQFKNLVGRVSRFSEVFSSNKKDMSLLEPKIFLIGSNYYDKNGNLEKFIQTCMKVDKKIVDDSKNPLLSNVEIDDKNLQDRLTVEPLSNSTPTNQTKPHLS